MQSPIPSRLLTLAPASTKAAELLHALYAETLAAAEASLQTPQAGALPDGAVLLQPIAATATWDHSSVGTHRVVGMSVDGQTFWRVQTPFIPKEHEVAGRWYGWASRLDPQGHRWERHVLAVIDNFGDLVEVAE